MIFILLFLTLTQGCQVHYNKDLLFDFSNAKGTEIAIDDNQKLYLNFCGYVPYTCCGQTRRLLEEDNTQVSSVDNEQEQIQTQQLDEENVQEQNENAEQQEQNAQIDENAQQDENHEEQIEVNEQQQEKIISDENSKNTIIVVNENQECNVLSMDNDLKSDQLSLLVDDKPYDGIIIKKQDIEGSDIVFLIRCSDQDIFQYVPNTNEAYNYVFTHKSACPQLVQNLMIEHYMDYKIILGILFILIGAYLLVYGYQFTYLTSVILAGLIGISFSTIVIGEATLDYDSSKGSVWIVFVAGIIMGLIYMNSSYTRFYFGCFNFGFAFGTVLSIMLNGLFYYKFITHPMYLPLTLSILIIGTLFGFIGLRYLNTIGILSCSFVGSYMLIKSISWFSGRYLNELLITKQYYYGFTIEFDILYYIYISLIGLLTLISGYFQYKTLRKRQQMDELFTYQDMKYYEMGNVNMQEQEQKKEKKDVQGFQDESRNSLDFIKNNKLEKNDSHITFSSKKSDEQ